MSLLTVLLKNGSFLFKLNLKLSCQLINLAALLALTWELFDLLLCQTENADLVGAINILRVGHARLVCGDTSPGVGASARELTEAIEGFCLNAVGILGLKAEEEYQSARKVRLGQQYVYQIIPDIQES